MPFFETVGYLEWFCNVCATLVLDEGLHVIGRRDVWWRVAVSFSKDVACSVAQDRSSRRVRKELRNG